MKIDNKKICLFMMFLLLVVCTMIFNKSSIEGHEDLHYDPNDAERDLEAPASARNFNSSITICRSAKYWSSAF